MSWGQFTCLYCNKTQDCRRHKQKYCTASCQLNHNYATGVRDPKTIALKANASMKLHGNPKRLGKPAEWTLDPIKKAEVGAKISKTKTGVAVPNLRKALTKDKSYWKSAPYQAWRKAVMRRDNFTCIECGDKRGGNLEADHIKPVFLFPELMLNTDNGRTLCKPCHRATPTWGRQVKLLTRADFIGIEG